MPSVSVVAAAQEAIPRIANPKRDKPDADLFPYYAGYSSSFVEDAIAAIDLRKGARILDPWNGAATTTTTAAALGYRAVGFDLNPALVLVAKARSAKTPSKERTEDAADRLTRDLPYYRSTMEPRVDPLAQWLTHRSVFHVRSLENAIQRELLKRAVPSSLYSRSSWLDLSELAAVSYVALFRTLRTFLRKFRTSNPTWFKTARNESSKVTIGRRSMIDAFQSEMIAVQAILAARPGKRGQVAELDIADSRKLPIASASIDGVITSPPYCTRIDYAIATLPELAVLGCSTQELARLRRKLLGSPLTYSVATAPARAWGPTCTGFLKKVARHESKASDTYYTRYFTTYFSALSQSLGELHRVLKPKAPAVIVVQDSHYKNVFNDLPGIVCDMVEARGWQLNRRVDFDVRATLAGIHEFRSNYRSHANATEAVLFLQRGS